MVRMHEDRRLAYERRRAWGQTRQERVIVRAGPYLNGIIAAAMLFGLAARPAKAEPAPPRSVADITTLLEQEKFNPQRSAKFIAEANAEPPGGADQKTLAKFYYGRAVARFQLGRAGDAVHDAAQAVDLGRDQNMGPGYLRYRQLLAQIYGWNGDLKGANEVFLGVAKDIPDGQNPPMRFIVNRWIGINLIQLGDLDQAAMVLKRNDDNVKEAQKNPGWASNPSRSFIEGHVAFGDAVLLEAQGKFHDAALDYAKAGDLFGAALENLSSLPNPPPRANVEELTAWMPARAGRALAREGRLADAEISVRRAVILAINMGGKYNFNTARVLVAFAMTLVEEGRYAEAETLDRGVLDIYQKLGIAHDSQIYAGCLSQLADLLALQNRWTDAAATYAILDEAIAGWNQARKDLLSLDVARVFTLYNVGHVDAGIALASRLVALRIEQFGVQHPETALAMGALAVGQFHSGSKAKALQLFRSATPIILTRGTEADDDDAVADAARAQRVEIVVETYMELLVSQGSQAAAEVFRLAEGIRGHSVQKALAQSSARAVAGDPALSDLARREQDLQKQIGAELGLLNAVLAAPPEQRDPAVIANLQRQIDQSRATHDQVSAELTRRFPDYAALIDPKPPTIEEIKDTLKLDEAFISFYLGQDESFVWVVPKSGPIAFASIGVTAVDIAARITRLRRALQPDAETIADIPAFDVKAAYDLYSLLLKPVEAAWRPARSLIVATNGALGLLPLGLLPTASVVLDENAEPLFAGYRKVPWLVRTHAITMIPSPAALVTLRHFQPGSSRRDRFIGFGDPYFNAEEAQEAAAERANITANVGVADAVATRGIPLRRRSAPHTENLNSADLGVLPRLPDTADELRSIARALDADPATVLHLGKDANEHEVETLDLSKFKIVAFATHGLLPGDLNGLTEPALALTAPSVAGVGGNGLLTMSKILSLKLDADWVVLSACNSGAGEGVNSEAASGLGRAFFYAGSRAILVTNWSVHSASARELVSDLFGRQAADPKIARAEALREAMVSMIDSKGYTDKDGNMLFAYAHPLFWAPYTIIGDGGINK